MTLRDLIYNVTCEGDIRISVFDDNGIEVGGFRTENHGGGVPIIPKDFEPCLEWEVTNIYPEKFEDFYPISCANYGTFARLVIELKEGEYV